MKSCSFGQKDIKTENSEVLTMQLSCNRVGHFSNATHAVIEHKCCHSICHKNPASCSTSRSNVSVAGGALSAQLGTHVGFDEVCPSNKTHKASHSCKHWLCWLGLLSGTESMWVNTALVAVLGYGDFTCLICPGEFPSGIKTSVIWFWCTEWNHFCPEYSQFKRCYFWLKSFLTKSATGF